MADAISGRVLGHFARRVFSSVFFGGLKNSVVRAIAISHIDGRQSNIVSKVFNVEYVEPDSSEGEAEELGPQDQGLGSDGHSVYSDNAENFKLDMGSRKQLRDQWHGFRA